MIRLLNCLGILSIITVYNFAPAIGQSQPVVPADYFDRFTYRLPADADPEDTTSFASLMDELADSVYRYSEAALGQYIFSDTNALVTTHQTVALAAVQLQRPRQVLEALQQVRILLSSPAYQLPSGWWERVYSQALLSSSGDDLSSVLRQSLRASLYALDSSFRNDIISGMKGDFTSASTALYQQRISELLEQGGESVSYEEAGYLLRYYFEFRLRKQFREDVVSVLYEISPALVEEATFMIPMRDGVRLHALVFRDTAHAEKVPAIVSLSPYPSGREAYRGNIFATNGYAYVYVDTRGRRDSEGSFFPYEDDARDYYDIIDWVSKQLWCDGQVASSGGSYLGFAQWQAIRRPYKHPALKAINPLVSVGFGIDFPRSSNMFYTYILQWAQFVSGKELNIAKFYDSEFWNKAFYSLYKQRLPFAKLDSVAGLSNPFFQRWVSHPDLDDYWRGILPQPEDYAQLDIPVLTITGYYDADQPGALYYYQNHHRYGTPEAKDQHYLLMGPYDHGGAQWQPTATQAGLSVEKEAQVPIYKYIIQWFDWVLKGQEKPAFLQDQVNYFATGSGQWGSAPSLEAITTDSLHFYLTSQAVTHPLREEVFQMTPQPPTETENITYQHDITSVLDSAHVFSLSPFVFETNTTDDSLYMSWPHNLVFETPPLTQDILLSNKIIPHLYLSLNVPDADFKVNLFEITPDGKSHEISNGGERIRYRKGEEQPSLLPLGEVARIDFDFTLVHIKTIKRGSRLRLTFESINSPYYEKNYGFGGVVSQESTQKHRIIEATLYMSPEYPSRIDVPYRAVPGDAEDKLTRSH